MLFQLMESMYYIYINKYNKIIIRTLFIIIQSKEFFLKKKLFMK